MNANVKIGTEDVAIPELNGIRALKALELAQEIMAVLPDLAEKREKFIRAYAEKHVEEFDRTQAKLEFGPVPVSGPDGELLLDDEGAVRTIPSPIDRMTEDDWKHVGHTLKVRRRPTDREVGMALFPEVMSTAREPAQKLLGLVITNNGDASRAEDEGTFDELLTTRGKRVLTDGSPGQILELCAVAVEVTSSEVQGALKDLSERMGNALSAFGINLGARTTTDDSTGPQPSISESVSSSGSPASSGGTSESSSEPAGALS